MYVFHRVAHHLLLYRWVHATHHIYDKPRLLTLFALNPIEALGFGCMLILVCLVYPVSALGLSIYLLLNVLFGLVGHIGVEPLRQQWLRLPVLRFISTSTFHAEHHHDGRHNFGFYTLLWDKVFGTEAPNTAPTLVKRASAPFRGIRLARPAPRPHSRFAALSRGFCVLRAGSVRRSSARRCWRPPVRRGGTARPACIAP